MCHLVLLMPILGLPIFWLVPLGSAIPSYIVIVLISVLLYWLITRAMRKPVQDGFRSLVGTEAEVVSRLTPGHSAPYLVRSHGELWSAYSKDTLDPGEKVNIIAVRGIGIVVERADNGSASGNIDNVKTKLAGLEDNERHCH